MRLRDFLKTGALRELKIGCSRSEVLNSLGEPVYWADKDSGAARDDAYAYDYPRLRCMFSRNKLITISVFMGRDLEEPLIPCEDFDLSQIVKAEEFEQIVTNWGIKIEKDSKMKRAYDVEFTTEGGVDVIVLWETTGIELEDGSIDFIRSEFPYVQALVAKK